MSVQDIEMVLVASWEQLTQDLLTKPYEEVELSHYLLTAYDDLPLSDYGAYQAFLDLWEDIQIACPQSLGEKVDVAFLIEWNPTYGKRVTLPRVRRRLDFPVELGNIGFVALTNCALNPASVSEIAKFTNDFDLDAYMPYFEPPEQGYFQYPDDFKTYSRIWLDNINLAAATGSGLLLIAR